MTRRRFEIEGLKLARVAASIAIEHKGEDVVVLEIGKLSGFANYFVLVSAQSERQVRALGNYVREQIKGQAILPWGEEGAQDSRWMVLDYATVVVHIFHHEARLYYDLDGLWREAPRVALTDDTAASG